jgi:EmrB/QacA subfamily drug resistance transporter
MTVARSLRRSRTAPGLRRDGLLVVVCLAQFMVILDVSIVNVALPSIGRQLQFSTDGLQWVVNAYTLTFAGFLMLGGRAADLLGRRRVFLLSTALFAACSLGCALAGSRNVLIGARALQGLAGALLSPATLSIVSSSLPEGRERNRGLALWGAMGALGGSSGAVLGGVLTQGLGWPAIFAVNVPIGAIVVALGARVLPETRAGAAARHFDATGAILMTAGLLSLTYGIVRTDALGWGSPGVLLPLALSTLLLAGFLLVEARFAERPLVPLWVFRVAHVRVANLVVFLLYGAFFPVWYFLTLYLQQVLRFSAIAAGLGFLPMTLSIMAASTLAPRAVGALGARRVVAGGMAVATAGMALLTDLHPHGTYMGTVFAGAMLSAIGMGFSLVPATIVAMRGLSDRDSGLGSGLLNTSRLIGGGLGLAILSTIAASQAHAGTGVHGVAAGGASALTHGFDVAMAAGAACCAAGALLAAARLKAQPEPAVTSLGAQGPHSAPSARRSSEWSRPLDAPRPVEAPSLLEAPGPAAAPGPEEAPAREAGAPAGIT